MTKLNQIIAIEKGVRNKAQRDLTAVYHKIQKPILFSGMFRAYSAYDEENGEKLPPESQVVQARAHDLMQDIEDASTRLFDVVFEKDATNTSAMANVQMNGVTVLHDVPVTYLLFLEKQLVDLHTVVSRIPTLDPSEVWQFDENTNTYRTAPSQTIRTKKVPKNHVKAPPTDKHPAQVEMYFEDMPVGTWNLTKFSGAFSVKEKTKVLDKIEALQKAVKFAREEANNTAVPDLPSVGAAVFEFIRS